MYTVNLKYKSYSTNCAIEFLLPLDAAKIHVTVNEHFVCAQRSHPIVNPGLGARAGYRE